MSYLDRVPAQERTAALEGAGRIIDAMVALSGPAFEAVVRSMRTDRSETLRKLADVFMPKAVTTDDPKLQLANILATLWIFDGQLLADGLGDEEPWRAIREAISDCLAAFDEVNGPTLRPRRN